MMQTSLRAGSALKNSKRDARKSSSAPAQPVSDLKQGGYEVTLPSKGGKTYVVKTRDDVRLLELIEEFIATSKAR
ncbi:hypothetical protein [Specibacter cremeus]|uniref:hypothetical protein n=1 Tax=Specibacter cremeus TaxID=1629051 RepID=UPI000F774882|nr:hypothetical protein [Specibacter cremeus]